LAVAVAQRAAGTGIPDGGQAEGEPPRISDARAGLPREHAEFGSARPSGSRRVRPATWRAGSASAGEEDRETARRSCGRAVVSRNLGRVIDPGG